MSRYKYEFNERYKYELLSFVTNMGNCMSQAQVYNHITRRIDRNLGTSTQLETNFYSSFQNLSPDLFSSIRHITTSFSLTNTPLLSNNTVFQNIFSESLEKKCTEFISTACSWIIFLEEKETKPKELWRISLYIFLQNFLPILERLREKRKLFISKSSLC